MVVYSNLPNSKVTEVDICIFSASLKYDTRNVYLENGCRLRMNGTSGGSRGLNLGGNLNLTVLELEVLMQGLIPDFGLGS